MYLTEALFTVKDVLSWDTPDATLVKEAFTMEFVEVTDVFS